MDKSPFNQNFPWKEMILSGSVIPATLYLLSTVSTITLGLLTLPFSLFNFIRALFVDILGLTWRGRMQHKHVLMSGGTTGIGIEMLMNLVHPGTVVSLISHNQENLERTKDLLESRFNCMVRIARFDLGERSQEDYENLKIWMKEGDEQVPIDLVIANAGTQTYDPTITSQNWLEADSWMRLVETNYLGVLKLIFPAIDLMKNRRYGHVVVMSSIESFFPFAEHAVYASTKAALTSLALNLHVLLRPLGIQVTLITPGFVRTRLTRWMKREGGGKPEIGWTPARLAGRVFARAIERGDFWTTYPYMQGIVQYGLGALNFGLRDFLLTLFSQTGIGGDKLT